MRFDGFEHLLSHFAEASPDAPALRYETETLSFAALYRRVRERAEELRAEGRSCLGLLCDGSLDCVIEIFASVLAGRRTVLLSENAADEVLSDQAKEAVAWLSEMDLLDDAKTAKNIVERCIAKGYGLARAKQALYEKRVPKHLWEDALTDYPVQNTHIFSYLEAHPEIRDDRKARDRAIQALMRRGHSYSEIRHCMENFSVEMEETDG